MWGDELFDPNLKDIENPHPVMMENTPYRESNCFLGLLGKHYGVPTENFGIPGGLKLGHTACVVAMMVSD